MDVGAAAPPATVSILYWARAGHAKKLAASAATRLGILATIVCYLSRRTKTRERIVSCLATIPARGYTAGWMGKAGWTCEF